jgi:hypothetical protein
MPTARTLPGPVGAHPASSRERGTIMVFALLVIFLLSLLGLTFLNLSAVESTLANNDMLYEGAQAAAEASVDTSIDQLSGNAATSLQAIPVTQLAGVFSYRSGHITDPGPMPTVYVGTTPAPNYTANVGTGYNGGGYVFRTYQINGTGSAPRNTVREVEVQVNFGPVPQ